MIVDDVTNIGTLFDFDFLWLRIARVAMNQLFLRSHLMFYTESIA